MYATITLAHAPMHHCTADVHDLNGSMQVSAYIGHDVYLSLTPDEARKVAEVLSAAAEKAERAQKRIDAIRDAEAEADSSPEAVA